MFKIQHFSMDPLQNGLSMLFKRKNKTSVENSIAVVGVTKALLIGTIDNNGDKMMKMLNPNVDYYKHTHK